MKKYSLKPSPITYFLSLLFGLFLMFAVLVLFLQFSHGNFWLGLVLALASTVVLSFFLAWLEVQEHEAGEDLEDKKRKRMAAMRGR